MLHKYVRGANRPRGEKSYKKLFQETVQLAKSNNKPLAQIARDLLIADSALHHWQRLRMSTWSNWL